MKSKIIFAVVMFVVSAAALSAQTKQLKADKSESFIKYRITHPLHVVDAVSKDATCLVDADVAKKQIQHVTVEVDVTSFDSGNSNRDSHAMEVVEALLYPAAEFISTSVTQKGDSVFVDGKLTFHGITKPITMKASTNWTSNKLTVDGGFNISLTAFHIKRPSLLLMPVSDTLRFTFKQVFNL